jgi:hypothetical protein
MNISLASKLRKRFSFLKHTRIGADDGWYDLIKEMCEGIEERLEFEDVRDLKMSSLESNNGLLHVEFSPCNEAIFFILVKAKYYSWITCEICGDRGSMHSDGCFFKVLCEAHELSEDYENYNELDEAQRDRLKKTACSPMELNLYWVWSQIEFPHLVQMEREIELR